MNNLLLRRRALMGIAEQGIPENVAVLASDNPEWMLFLYENGIAANPDYCTVIEAAAVENFSGMTASTPIIHADLRYFTNLTISANGLSNVVTTSCKKLTLPNKAGINTIEGNSSFHGANPYTLIIPALVEHFNGNCINDRYSHATYIFEGSTPPSHDWTAELKNNSNGTLDAIYVPDSAVNTYKNTYLTTGNTGNYLYSPYADIIYPMSDYVEPTE